MTQAERGLFERINGCIKNGFLGTDVYIPRILEVCAEFEQRLADAKEAVDSNLLVECALAGVQYSGSYADGIMALRDRLAEAEAKLAQAESVIAQKNLALTAAKQLLAEAERDARRLHYLTADLARIDLAVRNTLLERLPTMSYSAASRDIDHAIAALTAPLPERKA